MKTKTDREGDAKEESEVKRVLRRMMWTCKSWDSETEKETVHVGSLTRSEKEAARELNCMHWGRKGNWQRETYLNEEDLITVPAVNQ